jgi:hypothetical protein
MRGIRTWNTLIGNASKNSCASTIVNASFSTAQSAPILPPHEKNDSPTGISPIQFQNSSFTSPARAPNVRILCSSFSRCAARSGSDVSTRLIDWRAVIGNEGTARNVCEAKRARCQGCEVGEGKEGGLTRRMSSKSVPLPGPSSMIRTLSGRPWASHCVRNHTPTSCCPVSASSSRNEKKKRLTSPNIWLISGEVIKSPLRPNTSVLTCSNTLVPSFGGAAVVPLTLADSRFRV